MVVVTVLVDWSGQGACLGCAASRFVPEFAVVVAGEYSIAQSSPNSRVSPISLVTVIGSQLNSGRSSSSGACVIVLVVVLATLDDVVTVDVTVVADGQFAVFE